VLLAQSAPPLVVDEAVRPTMTDGERLTAMFTTHFDFVWRSLRRLGVHDAAVDDAAQEVFVVAQRKLRAIEHGKEKAFLFGTAVRVAADSRRARGRRRETPNEAAAATSPDPGARTDELVEQKRARELLDRVIAALPDDARPVFVLYELEGMTMAEIAACLAIPPGTVASRLRRAREAFEIVLAEHQAKRGADV
jgi:RNA polymerase sigma-70 factor, ECF subfamily